MHGADEGHGIHFDRNDAAACFVDTGYAARLIHHAHDPAAENIAIGVGVLRHGDTAHSEFAMWHRLICHMSPCPRFWAKCSERGRGRQGLYSESKRVAEFVKSVTLGA